MNKEISPSIGISESTTIEWKPSLSQIHEIIESITAFANTDGGRLFVGISKTGEVQGVQIGKGTVEGLVNRIAQHTDPKIQPKITVKKIEGKQIIVIEVKPSKDKLVLADGRPYKRVGPSTRQMGKDEYEERIFEKQKRFTVPAKTTIKDALLRLNLLHGGKLINTAILLFGKDPQKFFVQAKIRPGRLKGKDSHDFLDMKILEGTIPELREKALQFIAEHTKHAVFFDANQRFDKWEYPQRALEEVLNNALAHRDYWSNADIHLEIYDDRIEVWNPGELIKPLTPEQL